MKSHDVSKDPVSIRPTTEPAGTGHRSEDGRTSPAGPASTYRSREKGREEWGLPPREGLRSLACTYLEQQAIHWPGLVGTPAVPRATEAGIEAMASAFEDRFRSLSVERFDAAGVPARWRSLGGAYARFSDEGSNPRSLNQQLVNILARARRDDVFVPWEYVCGDAAISGTLACRRGYRLLKAIVEQRGQTHVEWLVIDELSRTNRNVIESLRLNELVRRAGVRLVGASDSFDSASEQSKMLLSMMATMHEMQIDQNASRVNRGMGDAFEQGRLVQPPGFGYRLVPFVDANGHPVKTRKGTDAKRAEVDSEQAAWIVRGAEMIAYEGKSPADVAKLFNAEKVSGKATWSDIRVRRLFHRERLVGKEVFRKTRQIRDSETGHVDVIERERDEWMEREVPRLRILSDELATAVKAKLGEGAKRFGKKAAELAAAGQKVSRVDVYPKVLVRPVCGGCGAPMTLGRSTGKYKSFFCLNAVSGAHDCTNRGYKSARIIDEAVLGAVSAAIFTEEFTALLTKEVNAMLAAAARRPKGSTVKLEREISKRERQIARVNRNLEEMEGDAAIKSVIRKVADMERDLEALRAELVAERRRNQSPPVTRVKEKDVLAELNRLREVLLADVGAAAPVLKAIVGDVVIETRAVEGHAKPQMVARFTIDAVPAIAALRRGKGAGVDDPTTDLWEFLHGDRWTMPSKGGLRKLEVTVALRKPPKYEAMLPQVVEMAEAGSVSISSRARSASGRVSFATLIRSTAPGSNRRATSTAAVTHISPSSRSRPSTSRSRRRSIAAGRQARDSTDWPGR
jgi:DNA invertase Pin-like site-specific DNA recombinase